LALHIRAHDPVDLTINTPYLEGWQITVDDRAVPPAVEAASGYMRVTVPAGSHPVEVVFRDSRVRAVAETISLVSVIGLVGLVGWPAWRRQRHALARVGEASRRGAARYGHGEERERHLEPNRPVARLDSRRKSGRPAASSKTPAL
jgi:hypothetical protein